MNTKLSVCIIAKNEEANLRQCLQALLPLQCEIVLVDTGSTDATRSIAAEFTDRLYSLSWNNDFAAAHNFAAERASCDWILSVDCDEFLTESDPLLLKRTLREHPDSIGVITLLNPYVSAEGEKLVHKHVSRLYNRTLFHFQGKIHETLTPINQTTEMRYFDAPLVFYHTGYRSEEMRQSKATRDLEMLRAQLETEGPDPYLFFQMGQCHAALGDKARAVECYDRGLSMDVDPRLAYVQDMIEAYGYALLDLKEYKKAQLGLEAVYDHFAGRADFLFLMGLIYMNNARFDDAIAAFTKATQTPVFSVEGVNDYSARYNIGVIYEVRGDTEAAVRMYRSCGNYRPALARLEALSAAV